MGGQRWRWGLAACLGLLLAVPCLAEETGRKDAGKITSRVPVDPLLVWGGRFEDPGTLLSGISEMITRFGESAAAEQMEQAISKLEAAWGVNLQEDLLQQLGPGIALSVDLPPVDMIIGGLANPTAESITASFGGIGMAAQVRDGPRLLDTLNTIFRANQLEPEPEGDLWVLTLRAGEAAAGTTPRPEPQPSATLFFGVRDGWFGISLSKRWVEGALSGWPQGDRLEDGEDYARVFSFLEAAPALFTYVNLPKLHTRIEESQMILIYSGANPELHELRKVLIDPTLSTIGFGQTLVPQGKGYRSTSYGPPLLVGGGMQMGIVAAIAIPNLFNAIDRGRQKRTLADLRAMGAAVEAYSIDNNEYPRAGTIEELASRLTPVFIRNPVTTDGWDHPIVYLSDGEHYLLASPGKDGAFQTELTLTVEGSGATSDLDADIIFKDGAFIQWPEGPQQ